MYILCTGMDCRLSGINPFQSSKNIIATVFCLYFTDKYKYLFGLTSQVTCRHWGPQRKLRHAVKQGVYRNSPAPACRPAALKFVPLSSLSTRTYFLSKTPNSNSKSIQKYTRILLLPNCTCTPTFNCRHFVVS